MDETVNGMAKAIIEAARQPFLVLDSTLRVVAANPGFCNAFRLKMEEILGEPFDQIGNRSWDHPRLRAALSQLPGEEHAFNDVEVSAEFDGLGRRTMKVNARVVPESLGPGTHTVLSIEDVTDRIRYERELHASESRFRRLFETAQDGILILDAASGRIEQVNPFLARLLGREASDLLGRQMWEIGFFDKGDSARKAFSHLQETGYIRFEDMPLETMDGSAVEVEFVCNVYPVGGRDMVQCNIREVGARKRAERERRTAEGKRRQFLRMEAIAKLAGGVAHEFNNLLTSINGYAELALAQAETGEPTRGYLREIRTSGERAAVLTRQLLAYSRQQLLAPRLVDPNAIVSNVGRMVGALIGENIGIEEDLDPEVGLVRADPAQIEQALVNIAVNARDAMPEGGTLTLKTSRIMLPRETDPGKEADPGHATTPPGAYAVVSITDTGIGMDREVQERIFEPFYSSQAFPGGPGLGLSMVQGIVAQSGGRVEAESAPGHGTTFRVFLPSAQQPALAGPSGP